MGRAFEVRKASMLKTSAAKAKIYSRFGKEIYIAAKAGVPDPEMNVGLKRMIEKAKANQVPADVIKRAVEKAKGGTDESYDAVRYEGFGPDASTIIVDCLTDNLNRTVSEVRSSFTKSKSKMGVNGCVSHLYDQVGLLSFKYEDEEAMLDALIMGECEVSDLEVEEGVMTIYVDPSDLYKAKDAVEGLLGEVEFDVLETTMLPQEYITLTSDDSKVLFDRLMTLLEACEDVQQIYHNVKQD